MEAVMTEDEMNALTSGLSTKSSKIRALADKGVSRADIARYLQVRYQHVRNVLIAPRPKAELATTPPAPGDCDALTIEQAKRGLALQFGVPVDAIEITIRG
jgi:hypothetical protein